MKAEVRFYEKGFASAEVPEIESLREELKAASKDELVEAAKEVELPPAAEYAIIYVGAYVGEEPVISITRTGIRDIESDEWIFEPEDDE